MFKNKLQKLLLTASVWLTFFPLSARAAGILPAATGNPGNVSATKACREYLATHPGGNCGNYSLNDILSLAITVSNWILASVGAIALLFFVYGGFVFILSGGNEERVKEGKQILINSIIGLAIVFTSYIIIRFAAQLLGADVTTGLQINVPAK
ncbi:MAG: pilin [Patescibacteria group bacterium]|nr:pilin [Patescibacteria group bacterium]